MVKAQDTNDEFGELQLFKAQPEKQLFSRPLRLSDVEHIPTRPVKKNNADKDLYVHLSQEQKDRMLFQAVKDNNLTKIEGLLKSGANPNIADENGKTPLMFIKSSKAVELLQKYHADRLAVDNDGHSVKDNIRHNKSHIQNKKFCLDLLSEPSVYEFDFLHADNKPFKQEDMKAVTSPDSKLPNEFNGGLWAAPYNPLTNQSLWQDFCYNNKFRCDTNNQTEHVVLHDDCKVLTYSPNNPEVRKYIKKDESGNRYVSMIDIAKDYDAVYVSENYICSYSFFRTWDIASLGIFNKDKIDILTHQAYADYMQQKKDKVYFASNNCNRISIVTAETIEELRTAIKNYDEYKEKHKIPELNSEPITDVMRHLFESIRDEEKFYYYSSSRRIYKENFTGNELTGIEIYYNSIPDYYYEYNEEKLKKIRLYNEYCNPTKLMPKIRDIIEYNLSKVCHSSKHKKEALETYFKTWIDIGCTQNQLLQSLKLKKDEAQILCNMMTQEQKDETLVDCVKNNNLDKMKILLQNGANPNITVGELKTPLLSLAEDFEASELLLQYKANPNAVNIFNQSALFNAHNPKQVTILLKNGANPSLKDKHKKTAKDYLSNLDNKEITEHTKCVNLIKAAIIRKRKEKLKKIFKIAKIKQFIVFFKKQKTATKAAKLPKWGLLYKAKTNNSRNIA